MRLRVASVVLALAILSPAALKADILYTIILPEHVGFSSTTISFTSPSILTGAQSLSGVSATFGTAGWDASVTSAFWDTTTANTTTFTFQCNASSTACLTAAGASGTYAFELQGIAPSSIGAYQFSWELSASGVYSGFLFDEVDLCEVYPIACQPATVAEPGAASLVIVGLVCLIAIAWGRKRLIS
jgi:hypothetical protein